jgi:subtilisin family serine protease
MRFRSWTLQRIIMATATGAALSWVCWPVSAPSETLNAAAEPPLRIAPPDDIAVQYPTPRVRAMDAQSDAVARINEARAQFSVDGTGTCIAVLDTGIRPTHVDFAGKIVASRNFTPNDGGDVNNVTDRDGHGTNVAGIAVARGIHTGVAPGANLVVLKVLGDTGGGSFDWLQAALNWVIQNRTQFNITCVNMSLGATVNFTDDSIGIAGIRTAIQTLRQNRVACTISAGNSFFSFGSNEGMGFPGIVREGISVGCCYDANVGTQNYGGPIAFTTGPKRITPFSQRLHETTNPFCRTDIFGPGAIATSAGILNDTAESSLQGTSQAAPFVGGMVLLAQQYALRVTGQLPTVDQLESWLRNTAASNAIIDGDDENDNVTNTNKQFVFSDALGFLTAARNELRPPPPPPINSVVTASYNPGTKVLTLTGDGVQNNVTITRQGTRVTVQGGNGTLIRIGSTAAVPSARFEITGTMSVAGNLAGGNDTLSLVSLQCSLVEVNMGAGNDSVVVNLTRITTSRVNGGEGTDTFRSTSSTITTNQNTGFP